MPEKDDIPVPPRKADRAVRYRRPPADLVQRVARRVVRGGRATFTSQTAFRAALLKQMRREEPLATIGGARLRRLLIDVPGVRLTVHYTERHDLRPLPRCPVCGSDLAPVRNRTLSGETIVLGQKCTRCEYWRHAERRVPVRYYFSKAGIDGGPIR